MPVRFEPTNFRFPSGNASNCATVPVGANTFYQKHFIVGDFNITPESKGMTDFLNNHNYCNLIKGKTCFKGVELKIKKKLL